MTAGPGAVGALVLAAGSARRMGRPKLLLPWGSRPLVGHVLHALGRAGVAPVVVVTGPDTPLLDGPAFQEFTFETCFNPQARSGMATSLATGAARLHGRVGAALVCLGDEPGIAPAAITAVVEAWRRTGGARPVVPLYRGRPGHPVLFPGQLLPEMAELRGDQGARPLLARHGALELALDLPPPEDVDTEEDYARLRSRLPEA